MAMKIAPVLWVVAGDARGATCACPSRTHKQGCAASVRRPRVSVGQMLHTATLPPSSNPKINTRRTGRQLPARLPSIAARAGRMGSVEWRTSWFTGTVACRCPRHGLLCDLPKPDDRYRPKHRLRAPEDFWRIDRRRALVRE